MKLAGAICGLLSAACAARPGPMLPPAPADARPVAVLPLVNLSALATPLRELRAAIEDELTADGVELIPDAVVEDFLAKHRIRYTGGVDGETARLAGEELGVGALLVTGIEEYDPAAIPRSSISVRLVAADDSAQVRFADLVTRAGDDSPGWFDLGVVHDQKALDVQVIGKLAASVAGYLHGRGGPAPCSHRVLPRELYRAKSLDVSRRPLVAVLPFLNQSGHRFAGELVQLDFVRELQSSGKFVAVEPGVLREQLLAFRIVTENGVSLDQARVILDLTQADYVLAGTVHEYEQGSAAETPQVSFTAQLLDRKNSEVVWESSSWSRGDSSVVFFDAGRIGTLASLSCAMARGTVEGIAGARK